MDIRGQLLGVMNAYMPLAADAEFPATTVQCLLRVLARLIRFASLQNSATPAF